MDDRPTPLAGVRVVELGGASGEACGRLLGDLGAAVVKVEPPGGAPSRAAGVRVAGVAPEFAVRNAGKRSVVIDLAGGGAAARADLLAQLMDADIWIEASGPRALEDVGVDVGAVRSVHPALVVLSISDFGSSGPYRDWVATDPVLLAMGGVLCRSGLPGKPPLLPPGALADSVIGAQAAWAALAAYWNQLETGLGDHIDFVRYEAAAQAIEPAMGTVGTAQAAGYAPTRDRPAPGPYPIVPCRDGFVRILLLAPRQWRAMRQWLGDPESLRDPELETIRGRALAADRLLAIFQTHFAARSRDELTLEGQARGVPVAPVLTLDEVLHAPHFRERGAIARREIADGVPADVPTGFAEIDGRRTTFERRAPEVGEHQSRLRAAPRVPSIAGRPSEEPRRPFGGLRILDLGVIVFGAELARLFCELGADVIKLESSAFPDGARVSPVHFSIGHRGSRSLGVNLRDADGVELVLRLAAQADAVVSNFKPGTLEKLGLGADALRARNPRLVVLSASALGATGPWSNWMGYGPLVRCVTGLTSLWRYPGEQESFSDSTVVHPDHYAARLAAITLLAVLVARRRSGEGAAIRLAQAESILMQLSGRLCAYSLRGGAALDDRSDGRAPWGVYPCAGDDEWCVITVRDDDDWRRLRSALGDPGWAAQKRFATAAGRRDCAREIDLLLSRWTRTLRPRALAARLQAAGVPAGFMQRPDEYDADPGFTARGLLRTFEQPGLEPLRVEDAPFRSERIPAPLDSRAPEPGEHTREICSTLLGLDDAEIERLVAAGALEAPAAVGSDRPRPRPRARPAGLRRHPDEGLADRLAGQQPR